MTWNVLSKGGFPDKRKARRDDCRIKNLKAKAPSSIGACEILNDACLLNRISPDNHVNWRFANSSDIRWRGNRTLVAEATRTRDRRRPVSTGTTLQTTLLRDRLYLRSNVFHG